MMKPKLTIVPGDPSGIGPELIAKLLNNAKVLDDAHILLVGDAHLWLRGAEQAKVNLTLNTIEYEQISDFTGVAHFDMNTITPDEVKIAEVTVAGGRTSLRCLDKALDFTQENLADGVLFGPFNKAAMTSAGLNAEDEHNYMARYLGFTGYHSEINVLDELMTTRVTSHIGLKDVVGNITAEGIERAINLAYTTLMRAGNHSPNVALAALNPHAGDNGKFGQEEIEIMTPVVRKFQEKGMNVTGPWPSDTVFLKAKKGEVDAVVTMYHDQGQIAIKLMGFDRGVTVAGGLPVPVATPAHGTAFDISGQGIANVGATKKAFELLVRMAKNYRAYRKDI